MKRLQSLDSQSISCSPDSKPRGRRVLIKAIERFGLIGALVLICIIIGLLTPYFLTFSNMINVLRQVSIELPLAIGLTLCILTGGIDLSVGSVVALTGCITAIAMAKLGIVLGIIVGLLVGAGAGLFNGLLITKAKIAPFVVTLGMMTIARGLALISTGGEFIGGLPSSYEKIGTGFVSFVPIPVVIALGISIMIYFLLTQTKFGTDIYCIGGNAEAARLSGIPNDRVVTIVYVLSGLMSAVVGIVLTARVGSAQPSFGIMYELTAIASVIIGGTSFSGGEGSLLGTLIGAIIIGVLGNGLNVLNVDYFWQQVAIGLILTLAVFCDSLKRGKI
jgi:ribose/xylose/arabinose/galactoside ABC-type transport system permease subunit